MDLNVDVLYLTANNRSTNIVYFNDTKIINDSLYPFLNKICLNELTTYNGRIEAIRLVYNIHKFIPIYINQNIILQPLYQKRSWNQTFVNICNIKEVKKDRLNSLIIFKNNLQLIVEVPYLKLKQYIEKCKFIQKDQLNKITERNILLWQRKILET